MEFLPWLGRLLVLALIVRLVLGAIAGGGRRAAAPPKPSKAERSGGTLVRDPHCGTYLPEARAIRVGTGANALYFCSTACRDAHRPAAGSVA